jgi:hypothetical protein
MTKQGRAFNPMTFLSTVGDGRSMMSLRKGQAIYAQGDVPMPCLSFKKER